jgi:sigma-54 dependent transcriptional regulator of gfr operon
VKVITYDYTSLLEVNLEEKLLKDYDVICVIGTLNPKLKNLHFIAIEELIMNSSLDFLTSYFADIISQEDMDSFQKKMLKNFSLTNIINNLTVLNPTQLLERVAYAIDLLQQEMKTTFTNNTCFGLYVHICCLMERLVTREGIESYQKELSDCNEDFIKFYMTVKKAFKQVEKYLVISPYSLFSKTGYLERTRSSLLYSSLFSLSSRNESEGPSTYPDSLLKFLRQISRIL